MINTVHHIDCLEGMLCIPDKSIDMILCDLPYGTTACKWDVIIPFAPLWKEYERIIKDNGAIVLTGNEPFSSILRLSNKMYKYDWIWQKERGNGFANANKQPLKAIENIMVFYKKQPIYNPQLEAIKKPYRHVLPINQSETHQYGCKSLGNSERVYKDYTHSYPTNIIKISREHNTQQIHPTQKPIALFEYLIKTYTNEGETVLDNCAGSGTTAIACINTNRNYILMEKEEKYYNIILDRIKKHTVQLKLIA